jgi:hypothetical protein
MCTYAPKYFSYVFNSMENVIYLISEIFIDQSVKENNTVAYRPVAKLWLYKQRPLLCNARNIE